MSAICRYRQALWRVALLIAVAVLLGACSGEGLEAFRFREALQNTGLSAMVLRLIFVIIGALLLLLGWKIYYSIVAVVGFLLGAAVTLTLVPGDNETLRLLLMVLGGVIGAGLALWLHQGAVFIIGVLIGVLIVDSLWTTALQASPPLLATIIGGIIGGLILLAVSQVMVIVVSAATGAVMLALGLNLSVIWALVFFVAGTAIQFFTVHSRGEPVLRKRY